MLTIRFTAAIPAAVAGEIARLRNDQAQKLRSSRRERRRPGLRDYMTPGEGAAYKAALDRLGGNALRCCADFAADQAVMATGVRYGRAVCLSVAGVMMAPGPRV